MPNSPRLQARRAALAGNANIRPASFVLRAGALLLMALLWACAPITPLFPQPSSPPSSSGPSGASNPSGGSPGPSAPTGGTQGPSGGASTPSGGIPGSSGGAPGTPGPSGGSSGGMPGDLPDSDDNRAGKAGAGTLPGGWETSNELPTPNQPRPAPPMPGHGAGSGGNQELEEALGTFDGEILSEREGLEQRSNETPGGAGNRADPATVDTGQPGGTTGAAAGGRSNAPTRTAAMPIPPSRPAPPIPRGGAPEDIPDARDDDIIARQLREAAMAESDPELRKALWEEYRRYKGS